MFSLSSGHDFQYYASPCDMRKGFDSLCGIVRHELRGEPCSGQVFIFINKPRNTTKLLHWEAGGLVIYHKRLEKGTFALPKLKAGQTQISWADLVLMIEGITIEKIVQKPRFHLKKT